MKTRRNLCILLVAMGARMHGASLIDFEAPLPPGLTPNNFLQGSPVAASSQLTNQFESLGVLFSTAGGAPYAALIDLSGQAPSGVNGIGSVNAAGNVDYTLDIDIFLVVPDTTIPAVTDLISIQGDEIPIPGNVVFSAYDLQGNLLTSGIQPDSAGGLYQLSAPGIHEFRLHSTSGTVAYDNLSFDTPTAATATPEPGTVGLFASGIAAVYAAHRINRRRSSGIRSAADFTSPRGRRINKRSCPRPLLPTLDAAYRPR